MQNPQMVNVFSAQGFGILILGGESYAGQCVIQNNVKYILKFLPKASADELEFAYKRREAANEGDVRAGLMSFHTLEELQLQNQKLKVLQNNIQIAARSHEFPQYTKCKNLIQNHSQTGHNVLQEVDDLYKQILKSKFTN